MPNLFLLVSFSTPSLPHSLYLAFADMYRCERAGQYRLAGKTSAPFAVIEWRMFASSRVITRFVPNKVNANLKKTLIFSLLFFGIDHLLAVCKPSGSPVSLLSQWFFSLRRNQELNASLPVFCRLFTVFHDGSVNDSAAVFWRSRCCRHTCTLLHYYLFSTDKSCYLCTVAPYLSVAQVNHQWLRMLIYYHHHSHSHSHHHHFNSQQLLPLHCNVVIDPAIEAHQVFACLPAGTSSLPMYYSYRPNYLFYLYTLFCFFYLNT